MSTQDFLAKSAFDNLANSIEQALSDTEGFRDEAENFADLARRGIRLVPPGVVANLSSFPANPEGGDAVFVESEDQIYFFDSDSSTWKDSGIIGSAIWGNVQGTLSDQTDLQTALDGKADIAIKGTFDVTIEGEDTAGNHTYNIREAEYNLKEGRCDIFGTIQITSGNLDSNMAGRVRLGSLPFNNKSGLRSSINVKIMRGLGSPPSGASGIFGRMFRSPNNFTQLAYEGFGLGAVIDVDASDLSAPFQIAFQGSYLISE